MSVHASRMSNLEARVKESLLLGGKAFEKAWPRSNCKIEFVTREYDDEKRADPNVYYRRANVSSGVAVDIASIFVVRDTRDRGKIVQPVDKAYHAYFRDFIEDNNGVLKWPKDDILILPPTDDEGVENDLDFDEIEDVCVTRDHSHNHYVLVRADRGAGSEVFDLNDLLVPATGYEPSFPTGVLQFIKDKCTRVHAKDIVTLAGALGDVKKGGELNLKGRTVFLAAEVLPSLGLTRQGRSGASASAGEAASSSANTSAGQASAGRKRKRGQDKTDENEEDVEPVEDGEEGGSVEYGAHSAGGSRTQGPTITQAASTPSKGQHTTLAVSVETPTKEREIEELKIKLMLLEATAEGLRAEVAGLQKALKGRVS